MTLSKDHLYTADIPELRNEAGGPEKMTNVFSCSFEEKGDLCHETFTFFASTR